MKTREPDFSQLLRVLRRERPERPVLFELFMNWTVYQRFAGRRGTGDAREDFRLMIDAYAAGGYDYTSTGASNFGFPSGEKHRAQTVTLNEGAVIANWEDFERYPWQDPEKSDYSRLDMASELMPEGMKLMVTCPSGVLENTIGLMGYDALCIALYEQPDLVRAVVDQVGSRIVRYCECFADHDAVGLLMSNDDWGFNTQTLISPAHMREYILPWHRRIVGVGKRVGKPVVLHSCGNLDQVMDDVIDMGYAGKHSYEDNIIPVEDAYRKWGDRIAILGGIDLDFMIRSTPEQVKDRCRAMLKLAERGGYALGSGNSIPEYIPDAQYDAMREVALEG